MRMLARVIGDKVMQVRLRLQGKVVSALDGIKAEVPGATTRRMSGRGVRPSAAAGRRLTDVPGRVQEGGEAMRCTGTQLDFMGHDPKPASR
jgi:hypothetical protein